jgi:hypothetical protein
MWPMLLLCIGERERRGRKQVDREIASAGAWPPPRRGCLPAFVDARPDPMCGAQRDSSRAPPQPDVVARLMFSAQRNAPMSNRIISSFFYHDS